MRWFIAAFALLAGCGVSFPAEFRVEDLRILNISAEPAEVPLIEPGHTATSAEQLAQLIISNLNTEEVKLTALVAHPDLDATFSYAWKGCTPGFDDLPCGADRRRDLSGDDAESVTFKPIEVLRNDLLGSDDPEATLRSLVEDPRDLLNGLYAFLILRAGVREASMPADTSQLDGEKRLVIFEPSLVRVAVREARRLGEMGMIPEVPGFELPSLCTKATDDDVARIEEFLSTRVRNQVPTFAGVLHRTRTSTAPEPVTEELELFPGEDIELRALFNAEDREEYRLIDDQCKLVDLQETISISWFTNKGDISSPLTVHGAADDPESQRTVYTAPVDFEGDTLRVRIWAIMRDGRGGSAHRTIDVRVTR